MSEKKTNLDILAGLMQRIAGSEAGERPEETIKKAIKELKKNKRLDPALTKQLKRAKIVDIEAEKRGVASTFENPEDKPILENETVESVEEEVAEVVAETPVEEAVETAEVTEVAEVVEEAETAVETVEEDLGMAEVILPVEGDTPAEGWWNWTWKKLNFEPTTLSWTDIALNELGQMRSRRLALMKKRKAANAVANAAMESTEVVSAETIEEAHLDHNGMVAEDEWGEAVWSPEQEDDYEAFIMDAADNEFDDVNGITYDDIDDYLCRMTPEDVVDMHNDEMAMLELDPLEVAEIDAEADRIAKEETAKEFGIEDYDLEMAKLGESVQSSGAEVITEALSRAARMKLRMAFRRSKARRMIAKKRREKRLLTKDEIASIAHRRARNMRLLKWAKADSMAEYRARPVAFRGRIEDRLKSAGEQKVIARLEKKFRNIVRLEDKMKKMHRNQPSAK